MVRIAEVEWSIGESGMVMASHEYHIEEPDEKDMGIAVATRSTSGDSTPGRQWSEVVAVPRRISGRPTGRDIDCGTDSG